MERFLKRNSRGVTCIFCNRRAERFEFKIKGTLQAWVCDSCAEKHAAQCERIEEPSNIAAAKEG